MLSFFDMYCYVLPCEYTILVMICGIILKIINMCMYFLPIAWCMNLRASGWLVNELLCRDADSLISLLGDLSRGKP